MGNTFAYVSVILLFLIIIFMPKRLTKKEIIYTWFVMVTITLISDLAFGAVNTIDLYDFVDKSITISDIFLQITMGPFFGIIFLNFMPVERNKFNIYIIGVIIISILYELLCVFMEYLSYKGWSIWYSIPVYFFGMIFLRIHLFYIRKRE